ncbi:MAG: hypothetical protein PVJ57_02435 [Phycisphaerae bacterium]
MPEDIRVLAVQGEDVIPEGDFHGEGLAFILVELPDECLDRCVTGGRSSQNEASDARLELGGLLDFAP